MVHSEGRQASDPARAMPTFAEFAERYLKEEAETKLKSGMVVNYRIYLRKHALPVVGVRKLDADGKQSF